MIQGRNKQPKQTFCDVYEIDSICYSIFSQGQLHDYSVLEIEDENFYENEIPIKGGLFDLRLGISGPGQKCQTCGETNECPGHIGHIKLNQPILHFGFLSQVARVLRCICHHCMRLKRCKKPEDRRKMKQIKKMTDPRKRLALMSKLLENVKKCQTLDGEEDLFDKNYKPCEYYNDNKVIIKSYQIVYSKQPKIYFNIPRREIKRLLQGVSTYDNECQAMGFTKSRPIDLMIYSLVVPPPQVRPYVLINLQSKCEDDFSVAYRKIIMLNKQIKYKNISVEEKQQIISQIQRIVASIMFKIHAKKQNLSLKGISNKVKSLAERWKGKDGRFRQNLLGKRVDFSARSVISPDPYLELNQIGIPQKIANNLTYPQKITLLNYQHIIDLCLAKKVKILINSPQVCLRNEQRIINVSKIQAYTREQMKKYVNYGMIAERMIQDGDYVLLNRQPTLHRMSMMAHKVRILPYNTFRINLSVCMPYNADFDGDQMNIHVPQSYESLSQLKNISNVENQIVGPKNGATTMGFSQDSLLGACMITSRDTFLSLSDVMNLLMWTTGQEMVTQNLFVNLPSPTIIKPQCLWTGKQIISLIIPKQIQIRLLKSKNKQQASQNTDEKNLIIKKGQIITGQLQKQVIGASSSFNNIIHFIWLEKGPSHSQNFINNLQRIVYNWLIGIGFSIGMGDAVPDLSLQNKKKEERKQLQNLYFDVFNKYRSKKQINERRLHQQGRKIMDSFEFNVNLQLNSRLGKVQQIVKNMQNSIDNNICKIVDAKSKGSETNLAQILYSVGNQNINGNRCPLGFSKRALPHFRKDDNSIGARGYVLSSFFQGLNPAQFFFHSMGGRQGLSDTAIKTSHVGYIQRKIVKSLQNLTTKYDNSVRDSKNNILQNYYGEDGFSAQYIQKHRCHGAEASKNKFRQFYKWKDDQLKRVFRYSTQQIRLIKKQYSKLYKNRRIFNQIFCSNIESPTYEYYCPITIQRIINQIKLKDKYHKTQTKQTQKQNQKIGPLQIYENVQQLVQECVLPPQKYLQEIRRERNQKKQKLALKQCRGNKQQCDSFSDEFQREDQKLQKINHNYQTKNISLQSEDFKIFKMHLRFCLSSKLLHKVHNLSRQNFYELISRIKEKFFKSLVPAGQAVGCIASQSIGEPTTQMTLNTFHLAGISDRNVTLGLPRLQQLLNCTKNAPDTLLTIYPKRAVLYNERNNSQKQSYLLDLLMFVIPEKKIKDFISTVHYYYNPQRTKYKQKLQELANGKKRTPYILQFVFSYQQIGSRKIWQQIYEKVQNKSKQNFQIDEVVDFQNLSSLCANPKIILRYIDNNILQAKVGFHKQQSIYKKLWYLQSIIKETIVCGIRGIKSVKIAKKILYISEQNKQKEYIVFQGIGTSLKDCLRNFKINSEKTFSNNVQQIAENLGIEAARQSLINELKQVLKPYGIVINYRHLSVLVDWMCMMGTLKPINRHGIHRTKSISTLTKASYQKSTDILLNAAIFSQKELLKDTSQKIIFGQQPQSGTNHCKLMMDSEKVSKFTYRLQQQQQNAREVNFVQQHSYWQTPKLQVSMTNDSSIFDNWRSQLNHSFQSVLSYKSPSLIAQTHMLSFSPTYSPNFNLIRNASPKYTMEDRKFERANTDYSLRQMSPSYRMINSPAYLSSHNKMNSPNLSVLRNIGQANKKQEDFQDQEQQCIGGKEEDDF